MVSVNWRLAPPEVAAHRERRRGRDPVRRRRVLSGDREDPRRAQDRAARSSPSAAIAEWEPFDGLARPPAADRSAPADQAHRHGRAVLHQRHDRPAEGRGAHQRQLRVDDAARGPKTWLLAPGVPNLVCLPMFHIGGAGWGIAGLFAGATNHVVREFVPAQILEIVQRERLQVMLLVPAMILFLVQAPQIRETDLSSLRLIVYGAAPIPAELLKQAMASSRAASSRSTASPRRPARSPCCRPRITIPTTRRSCCPAAMRRKASSCASSATTARTCRPARSARSPCARPR